MRMETTTMWGWKRADNVRMDNVRTDSCIASLCGTQRADALIVGMVDTSRGPCAATPVVELPQAAEDSADPCGE